MDDALWPENKAVGNNGYQVLILVLMDDALWPYKSVASIKAEDVLILVLMDDALWLSALRLKKMEH